MPFTNIGIHERINKNQTDLHPWPINMLSRPFIRDGCTLQPLQNEKKHLQKNPWHQTLWHRQYCSGFSPYHASPPLLEVAYFNCCNGKVANDIPASRGRQAVLQRALQKTTASVPFKEARKIAADISVCGCRKPTPSPLLLWKPHGSQWDGSLAAASPSPRSFPGSAPLHSLMLFSHSRPAPADYFTACCYFYLLASLLSCLNQLLLPFSSPSACKIAGWRLSSLAPVPSLLEGFSVRLSLKSAFSFFIPNFQQPRHDTFVFLYLSPPAWLW